MTIFAIRPTTEAASHRPGLEVGRPGSHFSLALLKELRKSRDPLSCVSPCTTFPPPGVHGCRLSEAMVNTAPGQGPLL